MVKYTIHGTLSIPAIDVPVTLELDLPTPPGPQPEPPGNTTWAYDILGTTTPTQGLDGPLLTLQAQHGEFDLPASLEGLSERTDLQAQLDAADTTCELEPGIYRCSGSVTRPLHVKGDQRVSIRASDNWSPGGACQWTQQGDRWTSSLQVPDWPVEVLEPWQATDAWRAGRAWIVMLDGQRLYIEPTTGARPSDGHFQLEDYHLVLPLDPTDHLVEVSVRGGAGAWLNITTDDVVLEGIDFRHAPSGLMRWNALESNGKRITYRGCMLGWTHGYGPGPGGSQGSLIEGCVFHNSGVGGSSGPGMHGLQFTNNVLFNNGFGEGWARENGSGGLKVISSNGVTFEGNAAWNNNFSGLWVDIDCRSSRFLSNVCWDNGANQIHYEISQESTIADNICFRTPYFAAPDLNERTIGIYVSSSRQVHVVRNLSMHLPSGFEFRAVDRGDMPQGGIYDIQHEDCTFIGRYNPPDQASNWGQDFGLFWGDNGDGATINQTSNWARNNRYSWNGPEPSSRWAYQPGHDVWVERLEDFRRLDSGTTSIGGGAGYLSEAERAEYLNRFRLSD